mmetsp:Transcript_5134/g.12066  ORF Transcript_5134/g.12066 Transcript_5134/m.12066 type:complete len:200 (+) Transcript_5134:87-686(+)
MERATPCAATIAPVPMHRKCSKNRACNQRSSNSVAISKMSGSGLSKGQEASCEDHSDGRKHSKGDQGPFRVSDVPALGAPSLHLSRFNARSVGGGTMTGWAIALCWLSQKVPSWSPNFPHGIPCPCKQPTNICHPSKQVRGSPPARGKRWPLPRRCNATLGCLGRKSNGKSTWGRPPSDVSSLWNVPPLFMLQRASCLQ